MVLQQLRLVDDDIATTKDLLNNNQNSEKTSGRDSLQDNKSIALAFEHGDEDNSGNWPSVGPHM